MELCLTDIESDLHSLRSWHQATKYGMSKAYYLRLLDYLKTNSFVFSLAFRFNPLNEKYLCSLDWDSDFEDRRIAEFEVRAWMGTGFEFGSGELVTPGKTILRFYKCDARTIAIASATGSIVDWRSPDNPEDFAYYDEFGNICGLTISHENYYVVHRRFWNKHLALIV